MSRKSEKKSNFQLKKAFVYVALMSAGLISLEIGLSRIFSAVLRYHFVFLVISIAICGIGFGSSLAAFINRKHRPAPETLAAGTGITLILFLVVLFKIILPFYPESLWLIALLTIFPFLFGGLFFAQLSYLQTNGSFLKKINNDL